MSAETCWLPQPASSQGRARRTRGGGRGGGGRGVQNVNRNTMRELPICSLQGCGWPEAQPCAGRLSACSVTQSSGGLSPRGLPLSQAVVSPPFSCTTVSFLTWGWGGHPETMCP